MGSNLLVRAAVALGVSAMATVGFSGAASATEATGESVRTVVAVTQASDSLPSYAQAVATVDSGTQAIGITVPHGITVAMYHAVNGGYLEAFCATIANDGYRWACQQVAEYAKAIFDSLGAPEDDECLRVEPRLAWPPIHVFYVKC